jgi:hypothetical protein
MNLVSTAIRYSTFILAIAGVLAMGSVLQQLRSQETAIPPPPVAPPQKTRPTTSLPPVFWKRRGRMSPSACPWPGW